MKYSMIRISLVAVFIGIVICCSTAFAGNSEADNPRFSIDGKLKNVEGESISNASITVIMTPFGTYTSKFEGQCKNGEIMASQFKDGNFTIDEVDSPIVRQAVSDRDGNFIINNLVEGPATIIYQAKGYRLFKENKFYLTSNVKLDKTLLDNSKKLDDLSMLVLLVPGMVSLIFTYVKERCSIKPGKTGAVDLDPNEREAMENPILTAFVNGLAWAVTFLYFAYAQGLGEAGELKLQLFDPGLPFEFYIPFLGFIGALLFVLNIMRKGKDGKSNLSKDFGMRLVMGPYLAIIMVVLFGQDLGVVDLDTPMAKGGIAFFSGLLAVMALQGLIEKGTEMLGKWREGHYEPSEIAEKFDLGKEPDLALAQIGVAQLVQLREANEEDLKKDAGKAGFDENLITFFKKQLNNEKELEKAIEKKSSPIIAARLVNAGVKSVADLPYLSDKTLEQIAAKKPQIEISELKKVCEKIKTETETETVKREKVKTHDPKKPDKTKNPE